MIIYYGYISLGLRVNEQITLAAAVVKCAFATADKCGVTHNGYTIGNIDADKRSTAIKQTATDFGKAGREMRGLKRGAISKCGKSKEAYAIGYNHVGQCATATKGSFTYKLNTVGDSYACKRGTGYKGIAVNQLSILVHAMGGDLGIFCLHKDKVRVGVVTKIKCAVVKIVVRYLTSVERGETYTLKAAWQGLYTKRLTSVEAISADINECLWKFGRVERPAIREGGITNVGKPIGKNNILKCAATLKG